MRAGGTELTGRRGGGEERAHVGSILTLLDSSSCNLTAVSFNSLSADRSSCNNSNKYNTLSNDFIFVSFSTASESRWKLL